MDAFFAAAHAGDFMGFVVAGGRITAIDALVDPDRLAQLDLASLED